MTISRCNSACLLAATGTDDTCAKRRSKRRSESDPDSQNGANRGKVWQDGLVRGGSQEGSGKPLVLAQINKACQRLASLVLNGADGTRTRNHRIDSPPHLRVKQTLTNSSAQKGAQLPEGQECDADFASLSAAWPSLPDHIKAAILTLVKSAREVQP